MEHSQELACQRLRSISSDYCDGHVDTGVAGGVAEFLYDLVVPRKVLVAQYGHVARAVDAFLEQRDEALGHGFGLVCIIFAEQDLDGLAIDAIALDADA